MSQRLGMADGRCFTVNNSSKLYNDYLMEKNGIRFEDNYSYRKFLQRNGPQVVKTEKSVEPCGMCDSTINLSKIY
jgi:hypothetical protein